MTTPNPSRSVSPEPTKGEDELRRSYGAVLPTDDVARYDYLLAMFDRILDLGRSQAESAYIPLVEAAEAVWLAMPGEDRTLAVDRLRAVTLALVQVPGHEQADTEQGGV